MRKTNWLGLFLFAVLLLVPVRAWSVGWTPTDAGLVLNFESGDQFLLSVMVDDDGDPATDDKEFFVCHYPLQNGGHFGYAAGDFLKLVPLEAGDTVSPAGSVWTIGDKLTHSDKVNGEEPNFKLDGICYTMWSSVDEGYTLVTTGNAWTILGALTKNRNDGNLCDVAFAVPTDNDVTKCMDPENTLGRAAAKGGKFNGLMGYNSILKQYYREVYWFAIPRKNGPISYTNAALITFNTTKKPQTWYKKTPEIAPGRSAYAYADQTNDKPHHKTPRTIFRIYPLNKPFASCSSYFFGWDVQYETRYRKNKNTEPEAYTDPRNIYTLDHFVCMEHVTDPDSSFWQTRGMNIPPSDSTYYYVGYNNAYHTAKDMGKDGAASASVFKPIDSLRIRALREETTVYKPAKDAFGFMAIDTNSTKDNLGVAFEPAGYFFQTSSGVNVPMRQIDDSTWMSEDMWYIDSAYMKLSGRVVLYTDSVFSSKDPGAEIAGWSTWVKAPDIPVAGTGGSSKDKFGWPRVHTNRATPNGGIEFVEATNDTVVIYHNNGHFGADIPYQYPIKGETTVTAQDARLLGDYEFAGWANTPNGEVVIFPKESTDKPLRVGQTINLKPLPTGLTYTHGKTGDTLHLYAKATYNGSINVAISFLKDDGKRYFLTHPGGAPRFARARHYDDWTNIRQGIGDEDNSDPNYLSSYKIIGHEGACEECLDGEYVLDPRHETMYGAKDSLVFYEDYQPDGEEYIGLYFTDPNTILANNKWAGLFTSTKGWPTPATPCVKNTKIASTHYLKRDPGNDDKITRYVRSNSAQPNVVYNATDNQFDGVSTTGTDFMISGVGVVDEHYVILPDTTDVTTPWLNEIVFDYHKDESSMQQVWSKLIGKQLMAQMKVDNDTIYFHPDPAKTRTSANELHLSQNYRLQHSFQYIYDSRAAGLIAEGDSAYMEETSDAFCCNIHSGTNSPVGPRFEIVDTLRVWLIPANTNKIKEYYGRWKDAAVDSVLPNGSRYKNILVKTKTYHYGDTLTKWILKPELDIYNFGPLASLSQTLTFHVIKERYCILYNSDNDSIRKEVVSTDTIPSGWSLSSASCSLAKGDDYFTIGEKTDTGIPLTTKGQNDMGDKYDTLTVSTSVTVDATAHAITAKVPLMQADLTGEELIWYVKYNKGHYFITIEADTIRLRPFDLNGSRWQRNKKELILGSKNARNDDHQYMTPWKFTYKKGDATQLALTTEYGVNKSFHISAVGKPEASADSSCLSYEYVHVYTNDNANIEEQVKLKYGADQWLKVKSGPALELTSTESEATVFSWGYLSQEYELLNNGTYPSVDSIVFGYNNGDGKTVQTRYKAYREYSMLINNTLTYLCREDSTDLAVLNNAAGNWKMSYTITRKADARTFDGGAKTSNLGTPSTNPSNLITTITPSVSTSPMDVKIGGTYVNVVDTLMVSIGSGRSDYRFKDWKNVSSLEDASLKIPLIRKTYHTEAHDTVICTVTGDKYNYSFPAKLPTGVGVKTADSCHIFVLNTYNQKGTKTLDANNNVVAYVTAKTDTLTGQMELNNYLKAEVRLVDDYGKTPDWCELHYLGLDSITVKCTKNGTRSPRSANIHIAYFVTDKNSKIRYVNFRLTVSQASRFKYANNQTLTHSRGYTEDEKVDGMQQVHENKRVLYYYNPVPYGESDQDVELPVRERGYFGWWRWYREGVDQKGDTVGDSDIPDSVWITPPRNVGKYNYPFRIIGDSVLIDEKDPSKGKTLVTMGRYTVFHYPAKEYSVSGIDAKKDPPSKSPTVMAPWNKDTVTYVVDISNYYDNLPLSRTQMNQVDTAVLDTMINIIEPTLSLREIFELHPWTEMADSLEKFKSEIKNAEAPNEGYELKDEKYMEDHVVMAPVGNPLLLKTEQRYRYDNLTKKNHSESLLGYYMRDDNWNNPGLAWSDARKDTMIWCGGWDADCEWFIYNPSTKIYTPCTYTVTESDDFLSVPAKGSTTGGAADTVYYCLRARSKATTGTPGVSEVTNDEGSYWFNICRYKVMYHEKGKYGPILEGPKDGQIKAIITDKEIEEDFEVLERLDFDYIKPGTDYHVYPRPLPWTDASYGYSYPVVPELPNNRYHNEKDFPGPGEYAIINKIPYSTYWRKIEQHGGAANGYMIYCDGMSSSGQVAALSLSTHLCEGQKMYFSGYIGNASNQRGKSNPSFTFSVQGWDDKLKKWEDITNYMTGDIEPNDKWYQIYFPIEHEKAFDDFRVRVYNMASDVDGNDFIIDDMCIFATKPPLIAYQANTKCVEANENDSIIHVVLRVDYQGFTDTSYNSTKVNYTVEQVSKDRKDTCFVPMIDGYLEQETKEGRKEIIEEVEVKVAPDTIYGAIRMPAHDFTPDGEVDSIFSNLNDLAKRFEQSYDVWKAWKDGGEEGVGPKLFRHGYIYENLDGDIRPVLYVVHKAKMTADNSYTVRMSIGYAGLMSSQCAMTSDLNVTSRMMLMLNGQEQEEKEVSGMCANTTYEVSMRVRGTLIQDSVAPIPLTGSCSCDWLLYGDTAEASSLERYGYKYSDIEKVVKEILRFEPTSGKNANQFAKSLAEVNKNVMKYFQTSRRITFTTPGHEEDHPYDILDSLVTNGFLSLYQQDILVNVHSQDSVHYVVFPIVGTGTDDLQKKGMEVCPMPIIIKLKAKETATPAPLIIGGLNRDSTQAKLPITVLADAENANKELAVAVDSIRTMIGVRSVTLLSTNDTNYHEGVHKLALTTDKVWPRDLGRYYVKGDTIKLTPASTNNYEMRQGYSYTFNIEMVTAADNPKDAEGCPIGNVPFIVSVVPDYLRWAPQSKDNNKWNDPNNWLGVTDTNDTLPGAPRFAPLPSTDIIIPHMPDTMPYPELPESITTRDSIKEVNFAYNICDDIRFLAGSAIGQQQRLTCDVVVVDMTMPHEKWALRSAPVTGMITGDLFMADADLNGESRPWTVGTFDAAGRTNTTGNAAFWPSVYSTSVVRVGNGENIKNDTLAAAEWSKVTNALTLPLPPAMGWAVYTRTKSGRAADMRLPKNDDRYYYYYANGDKAESYFEDNLRELRTTSATCAGFDGAGQLAYRTSGQTYTLSKAESTTNFVFGNPTMGYIDIWGFIADNKAKGFVEEFRYIDEGGLWRVVSKETAEASTDTITELKRYLPPMHAIVLTVAEAASSKDVTLNANRIVTHPSQKVRPVPASAPRRVGASGRRRGIMTVTATNSASSRCTTRLLIGQGYSDEVRKGEDAVLTTVNIDKYSTTAYPATPFNIYAVEEGYGLSIDLLDEVLNIPVSFYMTNLSFDPVTKLWFTGVNSIDGQLVLYDAQRDTERAIIDGICLEIETPENSHEVRYYIRRHGYRPGTATDPVATGFESWGTDEEEQAIKYVQDGVVYILRNGHIYTIFGQKIR